MRVVLLLAALFMSALAHAEELLVIAHPQVPDNAISREDLAAVYLIQKSRWSDDMLVVPVNREADSAIREQFSREVLNHSPRELADYWNRLRFRGKQPPLILTSNQAIAGFVRNVPGAIGYIVSRQPPAGVKVLTRIP